MISFTQKGDFSKVTKYLEDKPNVIRKLILHKYGRLGVKALEEATPKDTGKTSESWSYKVESSKDVMSITWENSNFNKGVPIALVIQYGHGTATGGYVEGRDYINPVMQSLFDDMVKDLCEEMTKV